MWPRVKVKTKPTVDPITLTRLKARVRVDFVDDDTLLDEYLQGAIARIDGPSGIGYALMGQAWELTLDAFPGYFSLPGAPVTAINSIKYYDNDGVLQTVTATDYRVDLGGDCARVEPVNGWPSTQSRFGAVIVNYQLGVEDAADVPADLIDALCLLIGHRYENRQIVGFGSMPTLPMGFDSIVAEYRRLAVA